MSRLTGIFFLAGALLAGCSKQPEADDHDPAGHKNDAVTAPDATAIKCAAHQAPKEFCFICDPALRDKSRLWCREHDRYEDRCWECHPDARDKNRLFCDEHALYEDECFFCHPELLKKAAEASATNGRNPGPEVAALMCKEHDTPERECGICHPELAQTLKPGESLKVRLPSANSAALANIQTAKPTIGAMADTVACYAELAFNQNKYAQIAAPVSGIIQSVDVDLGAKVEEHQAVANIWSASIAEAVAKAVLTHQTLERERKLRAERVTSEKDLQEAEAAHRTACQQLRTLGFTEEQIDELGGKPQESVLLGVQAPFAGEIVERVAVRGALVDAGKPLFTLADRSTMWAMLNIPETELGRLTIGQTVELRVDSLPDRAFTGPLTWIGAEVDERTRMARARAEVPNPDGVLRARMFARARILLRRNQSALLIPDSAVQRVEGRSLVFVKRDVDLFDARAVRLGARLNGKIEVLEGLKPTEDVVVTHSFSMKSQLLASRLGAGCADD